jgi:TolB-like protein
VRAISEGDEYESRTSRIDGTNGDWRVTFPAQAPAGSDEHALPAPRLSIVVLPFASLDGDPEQEYFADGVTESLTSDLSRIRGMFVAARNSAFSYKGKSADVRQIGRELGVRYVLEGSVQRSGNRMRLNVQLIDAETGTHIWADRFDKPVADLFDMQDEIVARLAGQLGTPLLEAEAQRTERSLHPDPLDLCFQGLACLFKGRTTEILAHARSFFARGLALDADNVLALVGVAAVDFIVGANWMSDDPTAHFVAAEAAATKALSLAPDFAVAHLVLGCVYSATGPRSGSHWRVRASTGLGPQHG